MLINFETRKFLDNSIFTVILILALIQILINFIGFEWIYWLLMKMSESYEKAYSSASKADEKPTKVSDLPVRNERSTKDRTSQWISFEGKLMPAPQLLPTEFIPSEVSSLQGYRKWLPCCGPLYPTLSWEDQFWNGSCS